MLPALFRRYLAKIYSYGFARSLIAKIVKTKEPKKWIFLIGCYNSGTTILRDVLSAHPEISILPREGAKFTDSLPRPEDYGWKRMWVGCLDKMHMPDGAEGALLAQQARRDWSVWWDGACSCYLEKSVSNTTRIEWINKNFSNAYFVAITRHPIPVVEGIRRKAKPEGVVREELGQADYPLDMAANQWVDANRRIVDEKLSIEKIFHLKYEDFCSQPVGMLEDLWKFLGLNGVTMECKNGILKVNDQSIEVTNMKQKSFDRMSSKDQNVVRSVTSNIALEMVYFGENRLLEND